MTATDLCGGASDFDFLHGSWAVRHRRLRHRSEGGYVWHEFGGTMVARPILAGAGNFDENVLEDPHGRFEACTVRIFDAASGNWSIFWIDGRKLRADPPVIGTFEGGEGRFLGADMLASQHIVIRFLWTRTDCASPRWEQAFSTDDGASWETNWVMEFDRIAETEKGRI